MGHGTKPPSLRVLQAAIVLQAPLGNGMGRSRQRATAGVARSAIRDDGQGQCVLPTTNSRQEEH